MTSIRWVLESLLAVIVISHGWIALAQSQEVPGRPRSRPPSELTGWADWEKAAEIFKRVKVPPAPPLSPEEAVQSFKVAPGFRLELAVAEPLVVHPIFFEFDPDGRIWAVEYRGYMRDIQGSSEGQPSGRIVVLEDTNEDGRADRSTVFLDGLVMPRTLAFVQGGVLVAEPPYLWYCRDTNGDLKCDSKVEVGRYGRPGNPQHTANGLAYGIDNWLHNADWAYRHRIRDGKLIEEPALYRGQFGVSFDATGRYVTCRESSPVEMDLIPEEYLRLNPALVKSWQRGRDRSRFGIAVPIGRQANECFPIRPTPGITLGALELREDGSLRTYTIVAGTGVYLGDQFPAEAYGNIFVPEAGGHLIGRLSIGGGISPSAARFYPDGQEILASTDERFRPMSVRTGPDGALYFADMYKGIIEHVIFMAPYIADQIKARELATGNDMGRIYRLVSTAKPVPRRRPRLSNAASRELTGHLAHGNGWWRLTAQRLLVERRDAAVVPLLESMVKSRPGDIGNDPGASDFAALGRLHALWTLEGMDALHWEAALGAANDPNPDVRAAALRLSERRLRAGTEAELRKRRSEFLERLSALVEDPNEGVRLQAALSLGALDLQHARELQTRLIDGSDSPLIRTAVLSGLRGREADFLKALLKDSSWRQASPRRRAFLVDFGELALDAAPVEGGSAGTLDGVLDAIAGQSGNMAWRGRALLEGLLAAAPQDLAGVRPVSLGREPVILRQLLLSNDRSLRDHCWRLNEMFTWPGKPKAKDQADQGAEPLSAKAQQQFEKGSELFQQLCAPCHQPHGGGLANVAPPLNRSEWVAGPAERLARVVLHGLIGPLQVAGTKWNHHMPGFREAGLTNAQAIAAVLTYVRRAWDNAAGPVDESEVEQVRLATSDRQLPWTAEELEPVEAAAKTHAGAAPSIRPTDQGELMLEARLAACFGERLGYRPSLNILAPWRKQHDSAVWQVELAEAVACEVFITLAADEASTGDRFVVESELGRIAGTVISTGGYDRFQELRVGELRMKAGKNRILLRPDGPLRAELADVRRLRMVMKK